MMSKAKWLLLIYFKFCMGWMDERPVLESQDGNLFISSAKDRNITLKTLGSGNVNINDINLLRVTLEAEKASQLIERWKNGRLADVESSIQRLSEFVEGPHGLLRRIDTLTGRGVPATNNTNSNGIASNGEANESTKDDIQNLRTKIRNLVKKIRSIERKLRRNDCISDPCQNGGTCIDLYENVQCLCPKNFEGPYCTVDVDECMKYRNTDLGCQNGATCHNSYGSYECMCPPGWYGKDCILKSTNCSTQNDVELCGNGHCISVAGSPLGYTCLCKQGWEAKDATNPACTKDVNECALNHPPCSMNPPVVCHNVPGSYFCGSCPQGYTGNGYYCSDIDECLVDNGGCSTVPRVQCINTMGSRICGPCPPGYEGDGITCNFVGGCKVNNGGCHPLALCTDSPYSLVTCRCPVGYIGDGIVSCVPDTSTSIASEACKNHPCIHGSCVPGVGNNFVCNCQPGYTGPTCMLAIDPCNPNPCRNNGICKTTPTGSVLCECTSSFTGTRCQKSRQACGAVLKDPVGVVEYPLGGSNYKDGQTCAWQLKTNHSFVFNVTFTRFSLETSSECSYDFLEIHDGESTRDHPIGRFCGNINNLPNNGHIISSHNALYFWFRSDHTVSSEGFAFNWTVIPPVCGGTIEADVGTISSPGYPGKYPPHRDCYWFINVSPGKRINLHFAQMMLEAHETCENDYLEINETTSFGNKRLGLFCNHTHPTPVLSSGSEVVLHFHSDSAGQDFGFQITFSSEAVSPDCGGVFTQDHGDISSPGFISSGYGPNMVCEWEIRLPPKERIKITWISFEMESSTSCQFDSVTIYEGSTTESPLIGRYCGYDLPESKTLNTNVLLIRLETDVSSHRQGFHLKYETACGGEYYEPTGVIQSPFYPKNYPPSKLCNYQIIQPVGKIIALTMQFLDIESMGDDACEYYDSLDIYDGINENGTRLASLCGNMENMPAEPFFSSHNFMYLVFESDTNVQYRGFQANYSTLDVECGGIHTAQEGVIQYPLDGQDYKNNLNCTWLIHAPKGHIVQLSWTLFNLEHDFKCRNDYVEIFDSYEDSPSKSMGKYCSNNQPPTMVSQGQDLTLTFRSDYNLGYQGFSAYYIFVDFSKSCGGHLYAMTGVIRSPNYPENYPRSVTCEWVIQAPNKHQVILRVRDFELEKKSCLYDYLEIRNGGTSNSPLQGKYCGGIDSIPNTIKSFSHQMYIKFVSDTTDSEKGFEIEWDLLTIGCGGSLTAATGDIISPNYPEPYGKSALCTWNIIVAAGSVVQFVFLDLELEPHTTCRFDYLEVADGNEGNRQNINRYCGNSHPNVITFESNLVTVRFRSDPSNHYRGFHIRYSTDCHNVLHGIQGVIESPNFPRKYDQSTNCTWMIEAPIGNKINVTFSHFELEGGTSPSICDNDYLEIEEGSEGTPTNKLGKFCDSDELPPKIASNEHQVFITFITDTYISHKGFRLEWVVHGCVDHLTKPQDSFTSPGYPNGYPVNIVCEWVIEVDFVHSVQLTFDHVDTEKSSNCNYDKIEIFSGINDKAPKLGELCHSDKPVVYTSSGNKMFVRFTSDELYADHGFSAKYESVEMRCGGQFSAQSGEIHSPNYPQNYPHNQNCEWLLTVDQDHVVNLTFTNFDIENTKNCSDDYVKVFDGTTRDSPLLGTFCHNKIPPALISTSNQLLVVMRSDSYLSAKGFKAAYKRACGATIRVKDQGILSTSSTLVLREEASNCSWILISDDPDDHVTLTFTHMDFATTDIDCAEGHYVQVHDGSSVDGPSLGTWCSNNVPPPITSHGNALTVNLVASGVNEDNSFTAYYSNLNTACGGNYTALSGTLTSPNYPDSYPMNAECVWEIYVSAGNGITLSFEEFDFESSQHCNEDYLEVREESGIGKVLGVFCSEKPETITSKKTLWIKFRSNGVGTASGFRANYALIHGSDLNGPVGEIASPLYPLPCKLEDEFSWRVTVEFGWIIKIEFNAFSLDSTPPNCFGQLSVYDGYDAEAPVLFIGCGMTLPDPIESTSNIVYIRLSSNRYSGGNWFHLRWNQIPMSTVEGGNTVIKLAECNQIVSLRDPENSTYVITSPGFPNGYEPNLECNWLLTSPPGTHLVFGISIMDLEENPDCMMDYVDVYAGDAMNSESATLLKRECSSNSTLTSIPGTNEMTVKFVSDFGVNGTGFQALVARECGGQLEGPNGVIESNNSTTFFVLGLHQCEWNVTVRPGRTIEVKFVEMKLTNKDPKICNRNFIMLKNGGSASSPLLGEGKYCGDNTSASLSTTGNRLYVKSVWSDLSSSFKLSYREIGMECGGKFILTNEDDSEDFSTPNYPNVPPPYSECVWTFMAPAGKRLSVHFLETFDLTESPSCEKEYVEIRDGGTESSKLMGRYCSDVAPSTMTSTDNALYVRFYSDVSDQKNGFKAIVTTDAICGGIMRGTRGIIRSPNYPNNYPKNQHCAWWIIGPPSYSLKIQFQDLHLPSLRNCEQTDHLVISEKLPDNTSVTELGTFCGWTKPDVIKTLANEAVVLFSTDDKEFTWYRGFSLNYSISYEKCGGVLTGMVGEFKTTGYPTGNLRRYCVWRITVPEGFQVVVDVLDLESEDRYPVKFFNDMYHISKIKFLKPGDSDTRIESSSNTMVISHLAQSGQRGLKANYRAVAPAPCGGLARDIKGSLLIPKNRPFNESDYFCQWKIQPPERLLQSVNDTGLTMTLRVMGVIGESRQATRSCLFYKQYVRVTDPDRTVATVCGNIMTQPMYVRSPSTLNMVKILNATDGTPMSLNLTYEWQTCGGILRGPFHTIQAPKHLPYPINCAWEVEFPDDGEIINLNFNSLNLGSCNKNYIIVRNGGSSSPQLDKICGNKIPQKIISSNRKLWIEYYAEASPNDFEFTLDQIGNECGSPYRGSRREIASPKFPSLYSPNSECIWTLLAEPGYHIRLEFVDRFNLELSDGCKNDYIQIFKWNENEIGGKEWTEIDKVCGRHTPGPYNLASQRLKVLFHSNEAVEGDGFRARWYLDCGGIFDVTSEMKHIKSPNYPSAYDRNQFCNYTLVAPGKDIIVDFIDFQVEQGSKGKRDCRWDNVTIITENMYFSEDKTETIYCGNELPPIQKSRSSMQIIFRTDAYRQLAGFHLKYFLNECGGEITKPQMISSLNKGDVYFGGINCTWVIKAPPTKRVVVRFEKFSLEYSRGCNFDTVEVYEGSYIKYPKRLASYCGNLTESLPVIKSTGNVMTVNFLSDETNHFEGFKALILFVNSEAEGCGGVLNITNSIYFRTQKSEFYEALQDCHWTAITSADKQLQFSINSIDLKNSVSNTSRLGESCTGDYLEIRDGKSQYAELLGKYCGNSIPPSVKSSMNSLWIRLHTDGTVNGRGITATIQAIDSLCGPNERIFTDKPEIITSPSYPSPYPLDVICRWRVSGADPFGAYFIRFMDLDLKDSPQCNDDFVEITDLNDRHVVAEGYGENHIVSGPRQNLYSLSMQSFLPSSTYRYCGSEMPHDFFSYGEEVEIKFKSTIQTQRKHKGFKLEFGMSSCDRNRTGVQGRLVHQGFAECWVTITAPANYTISLYFNHFRLVDDSECKENALKIFDGGFTDHILSSMCGYQIPNPVFSTGNKLSLHSYQTAPRRTSNYDITYVATDQGRGCGGKIFNYGGRFTSPLYPGPYRNASDCTWEISVPVGFKVALTFIDFDIGSEEICGSDNLKVAEHASASIFCGKDTPADYYAESNQISVTYRTSVNNGGRGWVIHFASVKGTQTIDPDQVWLY